ncbi:hypothetical protein K439DRAFT_1616613 [Ramaria rubella]|nr:hypothetical protein K439DRAFT_1616613 [Ramaria rubella]
MYGVLRYSGKFSLPKFLYLGARYFGLALVFFFTAGKWDSQCEAKELMNSFFILRLTKLSPLKIPPIICQVSTPFESFGSALLVAFGEGLFVLRVYALYNRNKFVLGFLLLAYFGEY